MRALLFAASLLLSSCATEYEVPDAVAGPIDSTFRAAGLPARKIKFTAPVTIQLGGTNNTASATTVGKAKAPVAAAPAAVATDASQKAGGTPWWVFALVLAVGLGCGTWLASRLRALSWFKK